MNDDVVTAILNVLLLFSGVVLLGLSMGWMAAAGIGLIAVFIKD